VALAERSGIKRVAVLVGHPNEIGGTQRVAANLVRDLGQTYQTTLLSVHPVQGNPFFQEYGVDACSLDYVRKFQLGWQQLREWYEIGRRLRRCVRENRFDAVLAIWSDMAIISALAIPGRVIRIGCEHIHFWETSHSLRRWRKRTYPRLDAVVSLTEADAVLYRKFAKRVAVVPNAVSVQQPSAFEAREKLLLAVGHLISRKGIDRLLWALKEPLQQNPDWKLVCVGGGERAQVNDRFVRYLTSLIQLLGLEGRVEFLPTTSKINDIYRKASIFVMGSRCEGLPMTLLEAKSFGVPCISFDCPTGPREIIRNGVDGYLVESDTQKFADAAMKLMRDEDERRNFGLAAMDDVRERYSIERISAQWCDLIDGLAQQRQP
jgi:amylovoran biosynthesis glycosyltransferase AmsD